MKKIIYLLLLICFFSACKKPHCDSSSPVTGKWEWIRTTGGIAGVNNTPQSTGRSWQLRFNQDLTCIQTGDLLDNDTGTYSLSQETDGSSTFDYLKINWVHSFQKYNYYFITADTLKLDDHIETDGMTHYFVRR